MTKGIDVSENNGRIDWEAVAAAGIKFAIVRSSYGRYAADEDFIRNVNGAHDVGIQCGAYHYSYALTPSDAAAEAAFCKGIIERAGVLLELPVWFSMSDADEYKKRHGFEFTRNHVTNICKAFLFTCCRAILRWHYRFPSTFLLTSLSREADIFSQNQPWLSVCPRTVSAVSIPETKVFAGIRYAYSPTLCTRNHRRFLPTFCR